MFVEIEDAKIYTVAFGPAAAPVLLGIGGWIGSWELWAEPFAVLSQHWRTVAYDHRGTGATMAPVESITFERLVYDIFAVMDALKIERCVLAAESAGALTALAAARKLSPKQSTASLQPQAKPQMLCPGTLVADPRIFPGVNLAPSRQIKGHRCAKIVVRPACAM
jgi:pimeloyl-ACP methyl ester carboxylesterase